MPTYSGASPVQRVDPNAIRTRYLYALMRGDRPFLSAEDQQAIGMRTYGNELPFSRDDYRHPVALPVDMAGGLYRGEGNPLDGSGRNILVDSIKRLDQGYDYGNFDTRANAQAFGDQLFRLMRLHYEQGGMAPMGANRAGLLPNGRAWEAENPPPTQAQLPPLPRDTHNRPITGMLMSAPVPVPQAAYSPRVTAIRRTGRKFT